MSEPWVWIKAQETEPLDKLRGRLSKEPVLVMNARETKVSGRSTKKNCNREVPKKYGWILRGATLPLPTVDTGHAASVAKPHPEPRTEIAWSCKLVRSPHNAAHKFGLSQEAPSDSHSSPPVNNVQGDVARQCRPAYLPFVRFEAEETTFLFLTIWVHRAVEMDATALFGKWSARSYPDWEIFVRKEVGKCATDVRGWRCVHDARLRQVGEVGLIIFVPQVSC